MDAMCAFVNLERIILCAYHTCLYKFYFEVNLFEFKYQRETIIRIYWIYVIAFLQFEL